MTDPPSGDSIPLLGSLRSIHLKRAVGAKLATFVSDEADLKRPLYISVVIPTKINVSAKTRGRELEALAHLLRECSALADLGYVDETVVIDASTGLNGSPDYRVLDRVVNTAYHHLDLFKREVDLISSSRAEALHASRGFFDFFIKVVHQFDPNISELLRAYGALEPSGLDHVPPGKGAGLWLSVPLSQGEIVCFIDSDIMNFRKEMLVALCQPLVKAIAKGGSKLAMVKAFYKRLTLSYESPVKEYVLGGRVTRLFAIPLLRVLARNYPEAFRGLDSLNYPLAGETSILRPTLEALEFPTDYSVEVSLFCQVARRQGLEALGQVDLDLFYHIGQSSRNLQNMVRQIAAFLVNTLLDSGVTIDAQEAGRLVRQHIKEGSRLIRQYLKAYSRLARTVGRELRSPIHYSTSSDEARLRRFATIIRSVLQSPPPPPPSLPPWGKLQGGVRYTALRSLLRRRANQSTFSRLRRVGLIPMLTPKLK